MIKKIHLKPLSESHLNLNFSIYSPKKKNSSQVIFFLHKQTCLHLILYYHSTKLVDNQAD
jgi:hypothetical protein